MKITTDQIALLKTLVNDNPGSTIAMLNLIRDIVKPYHTALGDVIDGNAAHDLVDMTGLSDDDCQAMIDLYRNFDKDDSNA